jgi:diaminopimelate decarboxylase
MTRQITGFKSRFNSIDLRKLNHLTEQFGSPLYLLDETAIVNRFREFKRAVTRRYRLKEQAQS